MKILVTGSTGFIGSHLCTHLAQAGHHVTRLVRPGSRPPSGDNVRHWDPAIGRVDADQLDGFDALVHLAGESILGRWTPAKKQRIRASRDDATRLLCQALAAAEHRPTVLLSASAIGYYGPAGDRELTEQSPPGDGFLARVAQTWEAACESARHAGVRVVNLRIGVVLAPDGGALRGMLTPFRLGLGGRVGGGQQWWSWIAIDDLVGAIEHCLLHDTLAGPVNATAPQPLTNARFTRTLGHVLGRPTMLGVPAFALRLALGEAASILLDSQRVLPRRLQDSGYPFRHPQLEDALGAMLRKPGAH